MMIDLERAINVSDLKPRAACENTCDQVHAKLLISVVSINVVLQKIQLNALSFELQAFDFLLIVQSRNNRLQKMKVVF